MAWMLLALPATAARGQSQPRATATPRQPQRLVPAAAAAVIDPRARSHTQTIAQLGFPDGLPLDGLETERTISFRLPASTRLDSMRLQLRVQFSRLALPASNLQLFARGNRIRTVTRADADSSGTAEFSFALPISAVNGEYATLTLRSAVAMSLDRCLDKRLSMTWVHIAPTSQFTVWFEAAGTATIRQAWTSFSDTIAISLPARNLTAEEFRAALSLGFSAALEGRSVTYGRLPTLGDVTIGTAAEIDAAAGSAVVAKGANLSVAQYGSAGAERVGIVLDAQRGATGAGFLAPQWAPLASTSAVDVRAVARSIDPALENPTLADLGITDLARNVGGEGSWTIPLDLRDFPVGRAPSKAELRIVTAPNTNDRQLVLYAFLNGTLVRATDINEDGNPQLVVIRFPSSLITIRNQLRILMQRRVAVADACAESAAGVPAQILPASRIVTTKAKNDANTFIGVTAQLSEGTPLYLPERALSEPVEYLQLLSPIAHALWSARRAPTLTLYGAAAPPAPSGTFLLVGDPAITLERSLTATKGHLVIRRPETTAPVLDINNLSAWSIAQVVDWNGHLGVQIVPAAERPRLPDYPEAYGDASLLLTNPDTSLFRFNADGREAGLLFNDGPTIIERIRGDWILWGAFFILLGAPLLVLMARAIIRRTPRRRIERRSPTLPS